MGREISEHVQRKLYAESMGRCMNPSCKKELFIGNGDIIEKAHIRPFCDTNDNSFENLIVLCPNCHKEFDKIASIRSADVGTWKQIRRQEIDSFFGIKYSTFEEMSNEVVPLLLENKAIYEHYYLSDNKELWNNFEGKMLANNNKLSRIMSSNLHLFHRSSDKSYSNLELVHLFLAHIKEFEATRQDDAKSRVILFPREINSMFGISPIKESLFPSVESLELLITELHKNDQFIGISIGNDDPYIQVFENGKIEILYLHDAPRLRQYYFSRKCFRSPKFRLNSLNYALKHLSSRKIKYEFLRINNLREISINNNIIVFVYEYSLNKVNLLQLSPQPRSIVVNLHNWNGESCISKEAYDYAEEIGVTLLDMDKFRRYINDCPR